MNKIVCTDRPNSLLINPQKQEMNKIIFKEFRRHLKQTIPVNSSRSLKPTKQNIDSELSIAKTNSCLVKNFKTRQSSVPLIKNHSNLGRNSVDPKRQNSPFSQHFMAKTKSEFYRLPENSWANKKSEKILKKFSGFFDNLDQTIKRENLFIPRNKTLQGTFNRYEKTLHKEYKNDRVKMKGSCAVYGVRKRIWRPDCAKVLRKVEKVLNSIPILKSL